MSRGKFVRESSETVRGRDIFEGRLAIGDMFDAMGQSASFQSMESQLRIPRIIFHQ